MSRIAQPENGSYGVIDGVEITEEVVDGLVKNAEAGFPGAKFRATGRPSRLKEPHGEHVHEGGYGTGSQFSGEPAPASEVRPQLRTLLVDGMNSGPGSEMNEEYFDRMRDRVRAAGSV